MGAQSIARDITEGKRPWPCQASRRGAGPVQRRARAVRLRRLPRPPGAPPHGGQLSCELLAERYGPARREGRRFIAFAVDGAARMQGLINDLLRYSASAPRRERLEPMDRRRARRRWPIWQAIDESGAVVTHDDLPAVPADPTQLVQLFQNLIGNALKFRDGTPRVHVAAERNGEDWLFSVRDNGIGIEPEYVERIFLIFQRLHTRDKYPGTGIGLAICKKIVERHGGRIWVESRPGQGSTFLFTLPVIGSKPS